MERLNRNELLSKIQNKKITEDTKILVIGEKNAIHGVIQFFEKDWMYYDYYELDIYEKSIFELINIKLFENDEFYVFEAF